MDYLLAALTSLTGPQLLIIVAGVLIGVVLGALPGLSSTFACAVMLPLTFTMSPVTALLFLGAIYMASTFGGSLGAILLNTPGTPQSITTTFDGFPMTKRGDGQLALSLACLSSIGGGLLGILAFILLAPPLASIALQFGPSEFFWLALLGLTLIASLSEGNLAKGIASGLFGATLSMVGTAVVSGDTRYTFGNSALVGGIAIVPATIGLLCIPVVLEMVATRERFLTIPETAAKHLRLKEATTLIRRNWSNLVRSSLVGTAIGALPAAGGAVASLVAYSEAMRADRDRASFGKGNPNGVIASESANNATVGSGLIPTFVLGIPGTPADAVILGAMFIHGLQAGPSLFANHGDLLGTFLVGLTLSTLLILPVGLLFGRFAYRLVVGIPKTILAPTVAMLTLIGAYAIQNSYADVIIMLSLGVFAWIIGYFGFPASPIVLGLLLGPIAEQGFSQALLIGQATDSVMAMFFLRPISVVLILAILISLFLPVIFRYLGLTLGARSVGKQSDAPSRS